MKRSEVAIICVNCVICRQEERMAEALETMQSIYPGTVQTHIMSIIASLYSIHRITSRHTKLIMDSC
jgi:hypothetical protein